MKGFKKDGKFRPTEKKSKSGLKKKNFETGYEIPKEHRTVATRNIQKVLKKRKEQTLDEDFQSESKLKGRNLGSDLSKNISTQLGRGTMSAGFFNVIDKYNAEHPENQIDYSDSGLDGLDKTIEEYEDEEIYNDSLARWKVWIEQPENKPIKDIIEKMQLEVDNFNKVMDEKYQTTDVFYRGTSIFEPEEYASSGEFGEHDSNLDFTSLTMSPRQAEQTFNEGVVIEYDADTIRDMPSVNKTEYTMDFVPVLAIEHDMGVADLEQTDSKQNALFVDEQEIRIDNYEEINPETIKRINYFPEKIGYSKLMNYLQSDKALVESYNNRPDTERVWAITNREKIEQSIKNRLNFFAQETEHEGFGDEIEVRLDFEHRFTGGLFA